MGIGVSLVEPTGRFMAAIYTSGIPPKMRLAQGQISTIDALGKKMTWKLPRQPLRD